MKMRFGVINLATLVVASTLVTGCATPMVWSRKSYEPADHPRLALGLATDSEDVLVCYDEGRPTSQLPSYFPERMKSRRLGHQGESSRTQRRAYWLFSYVATQKELREKPPFTDPTAYERLSPITVIEVAPTNTPSATGYCAFANPDSRVFHLYRDGEKLGDFWLPAYETAAPVTVGRVALTPPAVVADAAIVAVLIPVGLAALQ